MAKASLRLVTPGTLKRTVTPTRQKNAELRAREYLTASEVEKLMKAAARNRYGHRDAAMILVAYRHGLRAAELVSLEWAQVDFATGTMHVRRVKQGSPSRLLKNWPIFVPAALASQKGNRDRYWSVYCSYRLGQELWQADQVVGGGCEGE